MRKPQVVVLNHFAAPLGEAGGTRHVELFSRLSNWKHIVIASNHNPQTGRRVNLSSATFKTVPVPSYSRNGMGRVLNWTSYAANAFIRGVFVRRVDIVYGSSPHLLAGLSAWLLASVRHAPFVLEVRDLWPKVLVEMKHLSADSLIIAVLTRLEEFLYRRASAIVVMAEGSRTELLQRGVPSTKISYIPNGADPADFLPTAPREELRARYSFDRFTALYAGAHGPANGLKLLLEAAADVPDVDVVLVGGGVLKHDLQAEASRRGLGNVRFMDPVPKSEIPDLLAAADIGLHVLADVALFRSSVSPNKVFDYMAAALPVLTNCPGLVSDLVVDANAGLAVPPNDIGIGIQRLTQASERDRSAFGLAGQRWIGEHQSRGKMAQRLETLLDTVIGSARES